MIEPIKNTNIATEAISHLIWQFRNKPNIANLLTVFLNPFQDAENVDFDLLNKRWLDTASGAALDIIGEIVGEKRSINIDSYSGAFVFDGNYLGEGFGDLPMLFGDKTYAFPSPRVVNAIDIKAKGTTAPKQIIIWADNTDNNRIRIDQITRQVDWKLEGETRRLLFNNNLAFKRYKLEFLDNNGASTVDFDSIDLLYILDSNSPENTPIQGYFSGYGDDLYYKWFLGEQQAIYDTKLGYDSVWLEFHNPVVISQLVVRSVNSISNKDVVVIGSLDGINWDIVYAEIDIAPWDGAKAIDLQNTVPYAIYKVYLCWVDDFGIDEDHPPDYEILLPYSGDSFTYEAVIDTHMNIAGNPNIGGAFAGLYSNDSGDVYTREDEEYRLAIKARIKINKSSATPEDVLDFAKFLANSEAAELWEYHRTKACTVSVGIGSYFSPTFYKYIWNGVKKMVPAGVKVLYVTLFNGLKAFIFNDVDDREKGTFTWDEDYWDIELWYGVDINDIDGFGDIEDPEVGGEFAYLIKEQ